ncbi:MAG: hypothetical protein K2N28_07345 [Muribaculaceae bacterium]|nr:hypothetical protein [Muribaculaceae bacterium]
MKNKVLYIVLAVIAAAALITIFRNGGGEYGSKAEVSVPATHSSNNVVKAVTLLIDNSGSMRGYTDFSGNKPQFKHSKKALLSITGDLMANCNNILQANSSAICSGKSYTLEQALTSLSDYSAFSGPITEVDKLIAVAADKAVGDSSVSVLVSDMILSYGKTTLLTKKDNFYNAHALSDLKTNVRNRFQQLKNAGKEVLIVKYQSDFNGNYYYNHTENIVPNVYKDSLMADRPFYFMIVGSKAALNEMCERNCIPAGYTDIFTTLSLAENDLKTESYSVSQPEEQPQWILGNPKPKDESKAADRIFSVSMSRNIKTTQSQFTFTFAPFALPIYINQNITPTFDETILSSVSPLIGNAGFTLTTQPYSQLPKEKEVEIIFTSPRYKEFATSSIDDDININAENLQGRTWGFNAVIEALYEAYNITDSDVNRIVDLKFNVLKK